MIEVKPYTNDKGQVFDGLFIDGERVETGDHSHFFRSDGGIKVLTFEENMANKIASHRFSDFSHEINPVVLYARCDFAQEDGQLSYAIAFRRAGAGRIDFTFAPLFSSEEWKKLWSISEYKKEFRSAFEQINDPDMTWSSKGFPFMGGLMGVENIAFSVAAHDPNETLIGEARKHSGVIRRIHDLTEASLRSKLSQDSVVMHFDFPEEVRVPCEQYLLYFAQFLRDLGVEADTALTHEAGQVLFTVTPADKQTALDKIRTALKTYLQLPANPSTADGSIVEYEIAAQRLAANVDHLKGQLRLAHAELRLAGATVRAQQVTIDRLLSDDVMAESLKDVTPKPKDEDREDLLGGTVALTKTNWKGVEFNLPEIFRRLRRLFMEDE